MFIHYLRLYHNKDSAISEYAMKLLFLIYIKIIFIGMQYTFDFLDHRVNQLHQMITCPMVLNAWQLKRVKSLSNLSTLPNLLWLQKLQWPGDREEIRKSCPKAEQRSPRTTCTSRVGLLLSYLEYDLVLAQICLLTLSTSQNSLLVHPACCPPSLLSIQSVVHPACLDAVN